ncbi:hypothetical protein EIN_319430 [Entamoeba invadens IP1]|uniref:Uncharacterized protein n=1 Tax=Entamoeba invadens IP1 TaxID=370355 RepID=A0A0A1TZM8_ENTIV|nr:hypothetical protein EIN_319430 [Entamoeba invadens IP1]ELP87024.1 hypothetical protein EIN_319430 [Entamoeba invadens IP1]|eukprot:XP_004253795.1 hypothetical protein EIN_319430 [Entamoeba invadens IP1]
MQTVFRPVTLPTYHKTFFPLVQISMDSFVENSFKRSVSVTNTVASFEEKPHRAVSAAVQENSIPLTLDNLSKNGLGFLSTEDKNERVYYWTETITEQCLYPDPCSL